LSLFGRSSMARAGGDPVDLVLASSGAPLPSAAGPCAAARKRKASAGDLIARAEQRREILRRAGLCKKLLGLQRKADDASTEMSAIAPAWNSTQRRLGDHVDSSEAKRAVRHRNRFSLHGCLKLAFTVALDAKQQSRIYASALRWCSARWLHRTWARAAPSPSVATRTALTVVQRMAGLGCTPRPAQRTATRSRPRFGR